MTNSKLFICSVFLFFCFFISFACSSYLNTTLTTSHQCSALLLFKQSLSSFNVSIDDPCEHWLGTAGYYPIMMNWNTSTTDCCHWDRVTCDSTGDVIGLDLSCGKLQGTLHPNTSLFNLPKLQSLNLAFNYFTGSKLPREIGRFSNTLTHLNFSGTEFSGQVPTDITLLHKLVSLDISLNSGISFEPHVLTNLLQNCTSLEELSLEKVYISSVLRAHLNISSSLKVLKLGATRLQGEIPHTIFNLQSLEILDLSGNSFTGQISREISHLPKLVSLDLSGNGGLEIEPHIFNSFLKNSSLLRDLRLSVVNIGLGLPTYLNISSSLRSLDLKSTNLKGKLPDNIFGLQHLEELDLSGNTYLIGPLPRVDATIPLKRLDLSHTNLSGEIPDSIGLFNSLTSLDLTNCGLTGSLPKSIGNLRHLTSLALLSNKLNGTLPFSLFSLLSLETLFLGQNQFAGKIDVQTFRQLTNLTYLDLSFNNFSGNWELDTLLSSLTNYVGLSLSYSGLSVTTSNANHHVYPHLNSLELASCKLKMFPESLRSMGSLTRLDLSSNDIHGEIPQWAGEIGGRWLHQLNLSHNFITGLPKFQWYGLYELYLQSNLIEGPFPPSICKMIGLSSLDLSNNSFYGVIPQCFGNITSSLRMINLGNNRFRGPFPPSICKTIQLWFLDLSNNSFDGVIPQCLGSITSSLRVMNLRNNRFQGTIPNVYENCRGIEGLMLNGNQLEGEVPSSLSNCLSLEVLDMGNNHLNGTFPSWLGDFPSLRVLILKSNNFHGRIVPSSTVEFKFQTLQVLDLSHNRFVGQLSMEFFQNFNAMRNVVKMNTKPEYLSSMGSNIYYSIIVVVKGRDQPFPKILVDYTIVDLSGNTFEGNIPNIMGSLNSLKVLNLSHNNLNGRIPHTFGNLSEIESLDLSCNQLTGEIPQSLVKLNFLGYLNLSENHLMGRIPAGKQFNTFDGNSFGGNPKLCGLPLPKKCSTESPQEPPIESDKDGDEEESGLTWRVVMLGYGCGTLFGLGMGYLMLSTGRPMWFNAIANAGEQMILKRQNRRRYVYIGR